MSYIKLRIYQLSFDLAVRIHKMSLTLPSFEKFEGGAQIRRSSKSVKSNIVEGYGRRIYKAEFIRFLIFAQASNDETLDHLETLYKTKSLNDTILYENLQKDIIRLGKEINRFIAALKTKHKTW